MTKKLYMYFKDEYDKTHKVVIDLVRDQLNKAEVAEVANKIIEKDVLATKVKLSKFTKCEYVETVHTAID